MTLMFRNLDVVPSDPVETWGFEGLLAAVDRGGLRDWRRITEAVRREPWGGVAQTLAQVFEVAEDSGVVGALRQAVSNIRREAERSERAEVVETIQQLVADSGLGKAEFARRVGTSASRMSTYLSGKTVPSATLVVRMRRLAARESVEFLPPFAGG